MTRPVNAPLLLVGFHRGVLPALRALGRPALVLLPHGRPRPSAPEIVGVREIELHGSFAPIEAAASELLDGEPVAAVVAVTERTVLVAGHLRGHFGLPGNDEVVALRCADKVEMKRAMDAGGVSVAPWREVHPETNAGELVGALGLPIVLKPRRDSGGRGQQRLDDERSLADALADIRATGGFEHSYGWLAEGWLDGIEMSVETFVHAGRPCFYNPTEYYVPRFANIVPAPLDPEHWHAVRAFVDRVLAVAGVERGMSHLELFRSGAELVFGELAVRPPGGRIMKLLKRAWGFDPWLALLRLELGQEVDLPRAPRRTAGAWVLHPGPGRVVAIAGLEEARALPHVRDVLLKVDRGHTIPERSGSGQDVGALYVEGPDRDTVAATLSAAHERLKFDLR